MKVGDLVKITLIGQYNMQDPWYPISEGDKAVVLKIYESDISCTKGFEGQQLYKIAMIKDGYIIDHLLEKEIKKLNKTNN